MDQSSKDQAYITNNNEISLDFGIYTIQNKQNILLFDKEDRLSEVIPKGSRIVSLKGYDFENCIDGKIEWLLNAGTRHPKIFIKDEISWLKDFNNSSQAELMYLKAGVNVRFGMPAEERIPKGFIDAIKRLSKDYRQIRRVYLAMVEIPKEEALPLLALGVEVDGLDDNKERIFINEFRTIIHSYISLESKVMVDIFVNNPFDQNSLVNNFAKKLKLVDEKQFI